MEFQPVHPGDAQFVQTYRPGGFTVSGTAHEGSLLVFPDRAEAWDTPDITGLTLATLDGIARAEPGLEVLLIGCGPKMLLLPGELRRAFAGLPYSVDVMETGAACRTFNILVAESRKVGAALTPI